MHLRDWADRVRSAIASSLALTALAVAQTPATSATPAAQAVAKSADTPATKPNDAPAAKAADAPATKGDQPNPAIRKDAPTGVAAPISVIRPQAGPRTGTPDRAQNTAPTAPIGLPESWIKGLTWRSIGPAAMGGRTIALAVHPTDRSTWWVATAGGGLLKTTNNGTSFEHQFDREATVAIGDVAVAPSNPDILYLGTGENNPRNSVSYGDGVYKSVDGGKTWKNIGLKKSFQIGKIIIHPKNPDIVWVGALGRCWGAGGERGLYRTEDGGKTWIPSLVLDDKTGVIDMRMHPTNPDVLLVATWERMRDGFDAYIGEKPWPDGMDRYDPAVRWGKGSGLWKTTDGGKSFKKITAGLPSSNLGRIGLDWYQKDPNVVFAIVDCEKIGGGTPPPNPPDPTKIPFTGTFGDDADEGFRLIRVTEGGPADTAGLMEADNVLEVNDKVMSGYQDFVDFVQTMKVGDKVKVEFRRGDEKKTVELTLGARPAPPPGMMAQPPAPRSRPWLATLGGQAENNQDKQGPNGHEYGGIYKSTDAGETWTRINTLNPRPMYFSKIRVDPSDQNWVYVLGVSVYRSKDGGKTFRPDGGRGVHADQHCLWIDPADGRRMILGCDGGFYVTHDRMKTWDHLNHLALGQFYHVCIDPRRPSFVYGGLQDNGSWGGPTESLKGTGPLNEDWIRVGGGDGFVCRVDPTEPDLVYSESQGGVMSRRNLKTGETASIRPRRPDAPGTGGPGTPGGGGRGPRGEGRGERGAMTKSADPPAKPADPKSAATAEKKETAKSDLAKADSSKAADTKSAAPGQRPAGQNPGQAAPRGYRFNWNTPFILSSHNPKILYCVGEYVFRSVNRGDDWKIISPEVTPTKLGSGTAVAESPRNPDVLWAGTDDGGLWVTKDGGKTWTDVFPNAKLPGRRHVATIECSRFAEGRAYVCFDAHRSDDDEPYLMVTEDFGATFKSIRGNLPTGSSRTLREDPVSENLLLCGTEFHAWASIDRGLSWHRINNNLPTVAVHEFAFHPTSGEVVAATHGRSLWVFDITPLRQAKPETLAATTHLFTPTAALRQRSEPSRGGTNRRFVGENPSGGASIRYALAAPAKDVRIRIMDITGQVIRELPGNNKEGLHRVSWNLVKTAPAPTGGAVAGSLGPGGMGGRRPGAAPGSTGGSVNAPGSADPTAKVAPKSEPKTEPKAEGKGDPPAGAAAKGAEDRPGPTGKRMRRRRDGDQAGASAASAGTAPGGTASAPAGAAQGTAAAAQAGAGGRAGRGAGGGGFGRASYAAPGQYRVVLIVDGKEFSTVLRVDYDPAIDTSNLAVEEEEEDEEEKERERVGLDRDADY